MQRLPSSHLTPVQPRWQPPLQYPVILSQFPGIPQAMLQFCRQFTPYNPIEHSGKKNELNIDNQVNTLFMFIFVECLPLKPIKTVKLVLNIVCI